jgi:Xaa-Pro aminopeptidase
MREDEIAWLNDYHAAVRARLAPHVVRRRARLAALRTQPI